MLSVILSEWSPCTNAPTTDGLVSPDHEPSALETRSCCCHHPPKNPWQCRLQEHLVFAQQMNGRNKQRPHYLDAGNLLLQATGPY